tara:strand:- start:193 stop:1155 length:963 start_codon:yes stop_codon:yes gene_type:complete
MSELYDIFILIRDRDSLLNDLHNTYINKEIPLRNSIITSCRTYQLILISILVYLSKYPVEIKILLEPDKQQYHKPHSIMNIHKKRLMDSLNKILLTPDIPESLILHELILQNKRLDEHIMHTISIDDSNFFKVGDGVRFIEICPMCIFANSPDSLGSIVHYFTLIKHEENKFICSAYGSDYVKVPPKIIKIDDYNELNKLMENLVNFKAKASTLGETFVNETKDIFVKFFLPDGIDKPYSEDDVENDDTLKFKMITAPEGAEKEWRFVRDNTYNFGFGILHTYIDLFTTILDSVKISGGRKRKKTKKNTKKKKTKRTKRR